MKKLELLLFVFLAVFSAGQMFAQCTPDVSVSSPGWYPDTLPDGTAGQPYDQSLTLVFPQDTSVDLGFVQVDADFCAFRIDSSTADNLPAGISYECDAPGCVWEIDHTPGAINRGCIRFFGTPTEAIDDDTLRAIVKIDVGTYDTVNQVCDSLQGIPPQFLPLLEVFLTQEAKTLWHILDTTSSTAIDQQIASRLVRPTLFPNPTAGNSTLEFTLPEATDVSVTMLDMMGRVVNVAYSGRILAGTHQVALPTENLANGIYLVRLGLEGNKVILSRKLTLQR